MNGKAKSKTICHFCGKCCVVINNKGLPEPCKYLIHYAGAGTRCMIYMHRIGAIIGKNQFCFKRENYPATIEGCPYNKEGLPPQSDYLNTISRYIIGNGKTTKVGDTPGRGHK